MSKVMKVIAQEKEWVSSSTGDGSGEKWLVTKEDDFPISVALRRFPAGNYPGGQSGYGVRAHPSLELAFALRGHLTLQLEGMGELEIGAETLVCVPAGLRHAVIAVQEETLLLVAYSPAYQGANGPSQGSQRPASQTGPVVVRAVETEFVRPWGAKGTVLEKRLLTKEDGFEVGFTLRYIPGAKTLEAEGVKELMHEEGYRFHTHPCLEVAYLARGHSKGYVFGHGEYDPTEGLLLTIPPGTRHGSPIAVEDAVLAIFNVPPFNREPRVIEKDGIIEEG